MTVAPHISSPASAGEGDHRNAMVEGAHPLSPSVSLRSPPPPLKRGRKALTAPAVQALGETINWNITQ